MFMVVENIGSGGIAELSLYFQVAVGLIQSLWQHIGPALVEPRVHPGRLM